MKTFFFTFKPQHSRVPSYTWVECDHVEGAKAQMTAEYQNRWDVVHESFDEIGVHMFHLKYIPFGSHEGLL